MTLSFREVRKRIRAAYRKMKNQGGWRAVGKAFGISGGMAFRIGVDGHEPKDPKIRAILGMSAMKLAPACPECGEVHVMDHCPNPSLPFPKIGIFREGQKLEDVSMRKLKWAIENREEWQ